MDAPYPVPETVKRECRAWLAFWAQFVVLGLLAVIGALFAGRGGAPGDYACGMTLFATALALAFMRLKYLLDGRPARWTVFLFVDDMASLAIVIVLFAIIGLAGLFIAAGAEAGSLHDAGVALFLAAGLVVFLSLKRVFDNRDAHR
jgi:hypothetical protein